MVVRYRERSHPCRIERGMNGAPGLYDRLRGLSGGLGLEDGMAAPVGSKRMVIQPMLGICGGPYGRWHRGTWLFRWRL